MASDRKTELAQRVVSLATSYGMTVGTAESCTGGLVSGAITEIAGSSAALRGGIVSYDPAVKHDVLGVSQSVIDSPDMGVVSPECASQMATGARSVLRCDVAVSITGIAGPGGAEPGKPVGTVWFGLAYGNVVKTDLKHFGGSRGEVRSQAVCHALQLLCEGLEKACGLDSGNAQ